MTARFTNITITGNGFEGKDGDFNFSARWDLFIIREAWHKGCDFEQEADGFGAGLGTQHGDWSGIRDSSPEAERIMLEKALNFLFWRSP